MYSKNETEFKQLFGVKKETFHEILAMLTVAYEKRRRKDVPRPKLTTGDQLFLAMQYWQAVWFGWSTKPNDGAPR